MQISINLLNDFVSFQSAADIEKDMRLSYSLWLFKNAQVTLAKAAELTGLDIHAFMSTCKQNEVAVIDINKEESLEELAGMKTGMILVVDCSAQVALSLNLFEELFTKVVVPEPVYYEASQTDKKRAKAFKTFMYGKVLQVNLEAHVILDVYADAALTDKLLIDYKRGRKVAKINQINTIAR